MDTLTRGISPARAELRALFLRVAEGGLWELEDGGAKILTAIGQALFILADGSTQWCGPSVSDGIMTALTDAMLAFENAGMPEERATIGRLAPALVAEAVNCVGATE